jgi:hypothetical protein
LDDGGVGLVGGQSGSLATDARVPQELFIDQQIAVRIVTRPACCSCSLPQLMVPVWASADA